MPHVASQTQAPAQSGWGFPPGQPRSRARAPLVVRDDDDLEVGLLRALGHDLAQRLRQAGGVGLVQVGCGLVQRQDAAVQAECLRQRQADDQACQHLRMPHALPAREPRRPKPCMLWVARRVHTPRKAGRGARQHLRLVPSMAAAHRSQ